jgi:hypothetical protein
MWTGESTSQKQRSLLIFTPVPQETEFQANLEESIKYLEIELELFYKTVACTLIIALGGCAFPKYETVVREKDTGYEKTYDPKFPLISYKAINYVKVDENGIMTVNPKVLTIYDELEAPKVVKTASEKNHRILLAQLQ